METLIKSYICEEQKKRTPTLETYKPCNNCIYYAWSCVDSQYVCKHPRSEEIEVKKVVEKLLF